MSNNKYKRDPETGLYIDFPYIMGDDGLINWRAMVKPEHLAINKQYQKQIEEKLGKTLDQITVSEVEDRQLLILLPGIKYLCAIRGFTKIIPSPASYASPTCVSITTNITWIPNIESEMREITVGGVGGASTNNSGPIGKNKMGEWAYYLEAIAENRSFVRAVKNCLRLNLLAADEIQAGAEMEQKQSEPVSRSHEPHAVLEAKLKSLNIDSFAKFYKAYIPKHSATIKNGKPEEWTDYSSIHPLDIWTILGVLDEALKKKEAAEEAEKKKK